MKPEVAYLAVLQFQLSPCAGWWSAVQPDAPTHLVCGGDARVWGATLCGKPFGCHHDAYASVGTGIHRRGGTATPCWSCTALARRLFPGVPVLGVAPLAQPIADVLRVPVLLAVPQSTSTPPRSTP